jgi:hypothetical protein
MSVTIFSRPGLVSKQIAWMAAAVALVCASASRTSANAADGLPARIEFNRDVRPILADKCFTCHGPDAEKREADLRLDQRDGALADRGGSRAIVPGKPAESGIVLRIDSTDDDERMPPAVSGKSLSDRDREVLRAWISQGAEYQEHWAWIAPQRPALPTVSQPDWGRNPIDCFIMARLDQEGVKPAADADRRTLIRRLTFDLLGLPPTPGEVDAFVADTSPDAYEKVVDRLLASPAFGERMATYWLDVVRYADSGGYHSDNERSVWPYRDYVIQAFNQNLPFDQFTIEQIAGDLLPNATDSQKIASGFNRLLQTTEEGGAQPQEYTAKYSADRVRNTVGAWMGISIGCCECHNHKFDPFTMKDFYSFAAFFADVQEKAVGRQDEVSIPTPEQSLQMGKLNQQLADLRQELVKTTPERTAAQISWEDQLLTQRKNGQLDWSAAKPEKLESSGGGTFAVGADGVVLTTGKNADKDVFTATLLPAGNRVTALRLDALTHDGFPNHGLSRANGNFVLTGVELDLVAAGADKPAPLKLKSATADFSQSGYPIENAIDDRAETGWAVSGHEKPGNHAAVFVLAEPVSLKPDDRLVFRMKHESQFAGHNVGRFRLSVTGVDNPQLSDQPGLPADVASALSVARDQRSAAQQETLAAYFRTISGEFAALRQQISGLESQIDALQKAFPKTLVSQSGPPRTVRILGRGNWQDESGEIVEPATPASLPPAKIADRALARLALARWMVSSDNPLVSRVFANRLWRLFFGQGLVLTMTDLGSQGALPTHPELLDWLAVDLREGNWDVKRLVKKMVMSRTYQQTSQASSELRQRDPNNVLLARQSAFRLDAEFVRDTALTISGLLSQKIGGPSVKPYQPAGYWSYLNFPKREWQNDHGQDLYRRGLYTHWQRTFLQPSLRAFDAPTREECVPERARSNTPLQSLALLNDPTYVEAARVFAYRILESGGASKEDRLNFAFRQALGRSPRDAEISVLVRLLDDQQREYEKSSEAAGQLLAVGESKVPDNVNRVELAAWTAVARVVLNLHETITRP